VKGGSQRQNKPLLVTPETSPGRVGGSMKEARTQGLLREEGKTYVGQDGDIMHIRPGA
jgi:hypothetical protein